MTGEELVRRQDWAVRALVGEVAQRRSTDMPKPRLRKSDRNRQKPRGVIDGDEQGRMFTSDGRKLYEKVMAEDKGLIIRVTVGT